LPALTAVFTKFCSLHKMARCENLTNRFFVSYLPPLHTMETRRFLDKNGYRHVIFLRKQANFVIAENFVE